MVSTIFRSGATSGNKKDANDVGRRVVLAGARGDGDPERSRFCLHASLFL